MSFPAYPSYRESGVEWLGDVPSHWTVQRLKHSIASSRNGVWGDEAQGDSDDIICVRVADFDRVRSRVKLDDPTLRSLAEKDRSGRLLKPGNLLLEKSGGGEKQPVGAVVLYDHRDAAICSNFIARIQLATAMHPPYWCYLHNAAYSVRLNVGSINQTSGIQNLDQTRYFDEQAPHPPFNEQVAIAAFLDRETAKIDALIEEQRRLIELLNEKRQAVISHAVTKGLDPHAPTKDSGIEWLREVPAHWEVRPIGSLLLEPPCYGVLVPDFEPDGVPMLRITDMDAGSAKRDQLNTISFGLSNQYRRTIVEVGDLALSVVGTIGESLIIDEELAGVNLSRAIARLRTSASCSVHYLRWAFRSSFFGHFVDLTCVGTAQRVLNMGDLASMRMPVPPPAEQSAINQHLTEVVGALEALIETAQSAMALLNERRAALVDAAVTGKIDVRRSAKVLPFPIDRARARGLVATEIIERSAHQATFGRVKFQKIAFLAEAHVGISELAGSYTREAAGPLDRALIGEMESGARSIAGIEHEQPGGAGTTVSYRLGEQRGTHRQELAQWLGEDRTAKLDKLIGDFAALSTKEAEAVATLYGVWNDALSEGSSLSDEEIISGFLNDWHPEKRAKFRASELPEWLDWMRRHGIVPTGSSPKTMTGRLFV